MQAKTVCSGHRVEGYYLSEGEWLCKVCKEPQQRHETFEETLARKASEARANQ